MKYIRTKYEVINYEKTIENIKYYFNNVAFETDKYNIDTEIDLLNKSIIKEADTIEELCDEFVAMCDEYQKPFAWSNHHKDYFKEVKQFYDFRGKKNHRHLQFLYGAIWTDKGLIYVAKMNEKEELELL